MKISDFDKVKTLIGQLQQTEQSIERLARSAGSLVENVHIHGAPFNHWGATATTAEHMQAARDLASDILEHQKVAILGQLLDLDVVP